MDSFISVYPGGVAAVALLLLRLALSGQVLFLSFATPIVLPGFGLPVAMLFALGVAIGMWTRVCAAALSAGAAVEFILLPAPLGTLIGFGGLVLLALAFLGPGAFSVDARRFGRRVISLDN